MDDNDPLRRQSDPRIDKLVEDMDRRKEDIGRIMIVLEGEQHTDARGIPMPGDGGMRKEISDIKVTVDGLKEQGNGGGGFSLRAKDKAQITALIGFIVVVIEGIVRV